MNLSRPYAAVAPQISGDVLVVLDQTTGQMTGRQVARLVRHGSPKAVNTALERLTAQGLVLRAEAPPAYLYTLNRDHLAYPAIAALANIRTELISRLKTSFESWHTPPLHASLFGSAARGDGAEDSDIDVFLVRARKIPEHEETWERQTDMLRIEIEAWTGNQASLVEFSEARVAEMSDDALTPIIADGILLAGTRLVDLVSVLAR
jgi:predicted nucleotidyltransferase